MHILTFTLRNELFAVDTMAVKEIVWLPELTPTEEMPGYIVGVFNLRGRIVPVMDLSLRFGHAQESYHVTDRVIILECGMKELKLEIRNPKSENVVFGIIVSDVHDVVSISEADIESYQPSAHLIKGEAKIGENIIMLVNHSNLVASWEPGVDGSPSPSPAFEGTEAETKKLASLQKSREMVAEATPDETAIFRERVRVLMQPPENSVSGMLPIAVVSLSGEYFGIDLDVVKEFADVREVTPVPCTPAHIVGDMNIRGEILTLVDICGMLNLRSAEFGMRNAELTKEKYSALRTPHSAFGKKTVISQINDLVAGVTVDDVMEVINVNPDDVSDVPASVKATGKDYIKGELPYQGKMLSILDMRRMLTSKEMVVDENK